MSDAEIPDADALEQSRPDDPAVAGDRLPREIGADVPEADALEQALEVPLDDDDAIR
jgi:hypothetical protein